MKTEAKDNGGSNGQQNILVKYKVQVGVKKDGRGVVISMIRTGSGSEQVGVNILV